MNSSTVRFGLAAVSITAGCLLWWAGVTQGLLLVGAATLILMPTSELKGPVHRRYLWLSLGTIAALMVTAVAVWTLVPSSTLESLGRISRHPVIVLVAWLFLVGGLHQLWRNRREEVT